MAEIQSGTGLKPDCLTLRDYAFTYPNRAEPALRGVSLSVKQGEFVAICGASGCGKTTLLRQLKPSLTPHGIRTGSIAFMGAPLAELPAWDAAAKIGFVQQNPESQIVTDKVWHELAFGLESLGLSTPTIRLRVAEIAAFFGIQEWFHKSVADLSGGQKQLLSLAGIMAMQPELLILDEPTSQLDPIAAAEFLAAVGKINRELGVTVLLTEHRLEEVFPLCSRAVVMDVGRIVCADTPQAVGAALRARGHEMFCAMPTPMRVWAGVESPLPCPVTVREGREWLDRCAVQSPAPEPAPPVRDGTPAAELDEVWFKYEKDAPDVLRGLSFAAYAGEITALMGGNGAGKSTTLSLIAGLRRPYRGKVQIHGTDMKDIPAAQRYDKRLAVLPQNPAALFTAKTVQEDLLDMLSDFKYGKEEKQQKLRRVARLCQITQLLSAHPYDLSGGEQQRAALAKVLLLEPTILLLDEPTKGLDAKFKQTFAGILRALTSAGVAVIMVSHDIEFCAAYADRCALVFDGGIVAEKPARAFFSGNSFYTSAANRMARHVLPQAVTAEDVIVALGGTPPKTPPPSDAIPLAYKQADKTPPPPPPEERLPTSPVQKRGNSSLAAVAMLLLAVPLTIFAGMTFLDDRKYLVVSLLIILETLLPFALAFERRKPQARELVLLAVLIALAVAGRAAFFMFPQVKPMLAVVIIAGVTFGGEAGFLVGAMAAFVSNFFFGQGPWTPWQMFALGLIGFLAGVVFRGETLRRSRVALCAFGGLSAFVLYGGLLNAASVLMVQTQPTAALFLTAYAQGLPFDLLHALVTAVLLALIARPMLEKLERIKMKYDARY
ncbi:MAG: ATP-binding cassette domain-containing protein [Oscillospiraceae bacterium]|jgi:energy-coupling factor transporter ATP-binding protein EcfA2/uncharacterized membrane protein|nr:ATP-binding cassette domain-containing protein [Oscillospiraceae bacterium]